MDEAFLLARTQFGLNIAFHILFPSLTIALCWYLLYFRLRYHRSGDIVLPKVDFVEPLKVEIAHFMDCIATGKPCLTGPAHAREVVRILSCAK